MNRIVVQYADDRVESYDNVTRIQGFMAFDMFGSYIDIYHNDIKTRIKQYQIISFEVEEG